MMSKKNNETTLTHLTKRFVKLLNANSDRVVNLNEASTRLSVAKRRIYDITNVLEGIGLLQKTSKNVTRWVDCPRDSPYAAPPSDNNNHPLQIMTPNGTTNATDNTNPRPQSNPNTNSNQLAATETIAGLNTNLSGISDAELLALIQTYHKLEEGVNDLEANIRQQLNTDGAYVTYHDIKSSFNNQTVIAVKAPPETRLEVNENLQINIKSENGQIEVYLYQHNNGQDNSETHQQLQNVYQTQQTASQHNHLQQQQTTTQPPNYNSVSSDEGRGRSTTDGIYFDTTTSGVYDNDPTLSSALSNTVSEDEDPFKPLVPFEGREEPHYNFVLDEDYTITSLFPEDNLGYF